MPPGAMTEARGVLRDYGNMSAATVMFVLDRALRRGLRGRPPGVLARARLPRGVPAPRSAVSLLQIAVLLVALQRLSEVVYGQENARKLLAAGGVEHGARHYPRFFALHGAWLGALLVLVPAETPVNWWLIGL